MTPAEEKNEEKDPQSEDINERENSARSSVLSDDEASEVTNTIAGATAVRHSKSDDFIEEGLRSGRYTSAGSLLGKTVDNKYRIIEKLGQGGMGAVYRAEHELMRRTIALKVLNPNLADNEDSLRRFLNEARVASRLNHPHAVTLYDFGVSDGMPYIAMEFVEGKTLKQILKEEGALPVERAYGIIAQAGSALAEAHKLGIVHRDLKPDNIMISERADSPEWVHVLDFGIAKMLQSNEDSSTAFQTKTGMFFGTPQYMSPEAVGETYDGRSDIYSLGIILYEMLSGDIPFHASSVMELLLQHMQTPPTPLRELEDCKGISKSVDLTVMKALAKAPEDRYQSVTELTDQLKQAIDAPSLDMTSSTFTGFVGNISKPKFSVNEALGKLKSESQKITLKKYGIASAALLSVCILLAGIMNYLTSDDTYELLPAGALRVTSVPYAAQMYLNDKRKGKTPLLIKGLMQGSYDIRLVKEGYEDKRLPISLDSKDEKVITVRLLSLNPNVNTDDLNEQEAIPVEAEATLASLNISSNPPGAKVSIDGELRGETPLELTELELRQYVVTFEKKGFNKVEEKVELTDAGEVRELEINLQKNVSRAVSIRLAKKFYEAGEVLSRKKQYPEAIKEYLEALSFRPVYLEAHLSLGVCYLRTGDYKDAYTQFTKARRIDGDYAPTYYNLATYYALTRQSAQSVSTLKKAIKLFPRVKQWAKEDPDFTPIKDSPEFKALMR